MAAIPYGAFVTSCLFLPTTSCPASDKSVWPWALRRRKTMTTAILSSNAPTIAVVSIFVFQHSLLKYVIPVVTPGSRINFMPVRPHPHTGFGIGMLSKLTGVNIETIRYYERDGILPQPPRTEVGHRIYADDHILQQSIPHRAATCP